MLAQQHRAIVAEHRLGTLVITGNIHDNNLIPIERESDAVISVNRTTPTPHKMAPGETDKGLLVP